MPREVGRTKKTQSSGDFSEQISISGPCLWCCKNARTDSIKPAGGGSCALASSLSTSGFQTGCGHNRACGPTGGQAMEPCFLLVFFCPQEKRGVLQA